MTCAFCQEPVTLPEGTGEPKARWHEECMFRATVGSVAHLQRRCSCYVRGTDCGDPPGLTRRQAAQAAYDLAQKLAALGVEWMNERIR